MAERMERHFVTFFSPGTFLAEITEKPIAAWHIPTAKKLMKSVKERYGATPYAFQFSTRTRGANDLDSKVSKRSGLYYVGCKVRTLKEVEVANLPDEKILLSNMRGNGWTKIVQTTKGWKWIEVLNPEDTVL